MFTYRPVGVISNFIVSISVFRWRKCCASHIIIIIIIIIKGKVIPLQARCGPEGG